jgi:hypothetical protein
MKVAGMALPILSAVVAIAFWVDSRYAHAEDFNRNMVKQNLLTQESLIELRLEQNSYQTRSLMRNIERGTSTPELDKEELHDLRLSREALRDRLHAIKRELQSVD